MELLILTPVVTRSLSLRRGDRISSEIIGEHEALVWLNAGIASAVKQSKRKREVS